MYQACRHGFRGQKITTVGVEACWDGSYYYYGLNVGMDCKSILDTIQGRYFDTLDLNAHLGSKALDR